MKTAILFGAGQIGAMSARLLGSGYRILAFADNYEKKWNCMLCGIPIMRPEAALALKPETVFLCVLDSERSSQMTSQLRQLDFSGEILPVDTLKTFDSRAAVMRLLAEQIHRFQIPGAIAELGVYRGEFAALLGAAFPGRTFHLFDTFEGFSDADVRIEQAQRLSRAKGKDFSDTSPELVLGRIPEPERLVVHKGWFPETFAGCEAAQFAFVSIDADLYQPTAAALPLFWERLSPGGVLMIHDVNSTQFAGVAKAVDAFCQEIGILPMPVPDLHGSVVLRK